MNVLMISPGYPSEMPFFARGLARVGATVLGIGDGPEGGLDPLAQGALSGYLHVRNLWDEQATVAAARAWPLAGRIDRVECLWEPGMLLAARLREALGVPGLSVAQTVPFRDKEIMKQVLDAAGIRTPRHHRARSEGQVRDAAQALGYPLIVKPIAGAGSADTYRVEDAAALEGVLPRIRHVAEVSVEEFIEGEEYTHDTICADGQILYDNICWYRPRPLIARTHEWVSSQTVALRDIDAPYLRGGREMGQRVLQALGFETGFTHMEWFRKPDGEVVFGEIGARPAGARTTEIMNYACDLDVFTGWAEAVTRGRLSQPVERLYNAGIIFKRAQGQGRIQRIVGLEALVRDLQRHLMSVELLPLGAHRRNWKQTLLSDGWLILRHPDLGMTLRMLDRIGTDLQLYAG